MKIYIKSSKDAFSLEDLTRDFIIENGGSIQNILDSGFNIEIGRNWNAKKQDYSGPFGKSTIVTGPGVDHVFRNTESAIAFLKKRLK